MLKYYSKGLAAYKLGSLFCNIVIQQDAIKEISKLFGVFPAEGIFRPRQVGKTTLAQTHLVGQRPIITRTRKRITPLHDAIYTRPIPMLRREG